jgi:hypothetical protein
MVGKQEIGPFLGYFLFGGDSGEYEEWGQKGPPVAQESETESI